MSAHDGHAPADISQSEWDRHRGEVVRTSAIVSNLAKGLKETNAALDLTRIEMKALRLKIAEFLRSVQERLDKHSDWQETTAQRDRAELEKELDQYRGRDERRVALWIKIVLGILASAAEAGLVHYLHLK